MLRGKRLRRHDLDKLYGEGLQLPGTTYLLDVTGISVDPGGRGYSDGDLDMCIDDPGFDVDLYVTTDLRTLTKPSMGDIPAREAVRSGAAELHGVRKLAAGFGKWMGFSPFANVTRPPKPLCIGGAAGPFRAAAAK